MYTLTRQQFVKTSVKTAWHFLQHPANLDRITPPDLKFKIVSDVPEVMFNGLIVEYQITIPFLGKHVWVTEIKHIRENHSFVDEQRLGPYRFWYHYHEIKSQKDGVLLIDKVHYHPPFGILGKVLYRFYIRNMLERIFNYRWGRLEEILPALESEKIKSGQITD